MNTSPSRGYTRFVLLALLAAAALDAHAAAPNQSLSLGNFFTCGITSAGGVQCWGANSQGQLGNGLTQEVSPAPVNVVGLSNVAAITSGSDHTCALLSTGSVRCWGENGSGTVGDGTTNIRRSPVNVVGLSSGVIAISASNQHTCALTAAGGVKCWGGNTNGQLGDGTTSSRLTPVDVAGLISGVVAIETGAFHSCALLGTGAVRCWGGNAEGELGTGNRSSGETTSPTATLLTASVAGVAARGGGQHSCALTRTNTVRCWGLNADGQLGVAAGASQASPVDVPNLPGVVAITAGDTNTCALTATGGVKCWGNGTNGQLGNSEFFVTGRAPADVVGLTSGVAAVESGYQHVCALLTSGRAKCWGQNVFAQLGSGTFESFAVPVDVQGFQGVSLVDAADQDNDGIPNGAERASGTNPLLKDNYLLNSHDFSFRLFVQQVYRDFLGRAADDVGLNFWVGELVAGRQTRASMIEAFVNGGEFEAFAAPMARLYFGTYLRIPDYPGLQFWTGEFQSGRGNLDSIATAFATAPEFVARYGNPSNAEFVNRIYLNMLGRAADAGGSAFWTGQLDQGLTRGQMLNRFTESAEYRAARFPQVFTTLQFAALLKRAPTQSEFDANVAALSGGATARSRVDVTLGSAEYRARFMP